LADPKRVSKIYARCKWVSKRGPSYGPVGVGDGVGVGVGEGVGDGVGIVVDAGVGMGGGVVSGNAGNCVGVLLTVVVSSTVAISGVSWVGVSGIGVFGLQPSSIAKIKTTATKAIRFMITFAQAILLCAEKAASCK